MRIFIVLLGILMLFGCTGEAPAEEGAAQQQSTGEAAGQEEPDGEDAQEDEVPGIIEVPTTEEIIEEKKSGPRATSQNDCSTMSPNCETCIAQEGCQWCKTTNACYYEGIIDTISSCNPGDWAETEAECSGPPGGGNCGQQTNCVACLSGSGCAWCIEGSVCADASTNEECFGGWMTETYQCNYASR